MRPTYQNFEDLVKQYEQELWEDEQTIKKIEKRLDNKATQEKSAKDEKNKLTG